MLRRAYVFVVTCVILLFWADTKAFDDVPLSQASSFVPKTASIPKDFMVELVLPQKIKGTEGVAESQVLQALVKQIYRPLGQPDRGPYLGKCIVLLQEWEVDGELSANFRIECWSIDLKRSQDTKFWMTALDTPAEVMAFVSQKAKEHRQRSLSGAVKASS